MNMNENDTEKSLQQIARRHGHSIVSLLIDIQESTISQQKFLPFLEDLECLSQITDQPTLLYRQAVNAFEDPDYVALSYSWDASEYEDPSWGRYRVQSRSGGKISFEASKVRHNVFDRILKYMKNHGLEFLWIDQHSIRQPACKEKECEHLECKQKRVGLDVMDLVYKYSNHPVALLATPIEARNDLKLLARILSGDLVFSSGRKPRFQLCEKTTIRDAIAALELLKKLTSDRWWTRGWIFQESYRGGVAMNLLIPHRPGLERLKRSFGATLFGDIYGELCVNIVTFSYESTRLCLAFESLKSQTALAQEAIRQIVTTAGRYTLLLGKHESMSPTIISDIGTRDLEQQWDRLAVVANCCQYSTRLKVRELQHKEHSISLSILALWLLNGEIFCNSRATRVSAQMTALEVLAKHSFKSFYAPLSRRSLSFNKGCRFPHVRLTPWGVSTKGHLWKLGRRLSAEKIVQQPSWVDNPTSNLSLQDQKRLTQLSKRLLELRCFALRNRLQQYLKREARGYDDCFSDNFVGNYMRTMASEVADAIDQGLTLRIASLWDPTNRRSSYRSSPQAIFICNDENEDIKYGGLHSQHLFQGTGPSLVFTASRPRREGSAEYELNDIDRHVSLEVHHVGFTRDGQREVPRLEIGRWILGLCFFKGFETMDVVFPWPPGLESITP